MCAAATKKLTPLCNAAVPDASAVGRRSPGSRCQCSAKGEMDREKRAQLAQPCLAESTPSVIRTRGTCGARYFRPHGRVCEKPGSSEMAPSQRHRGDLLRRAASRATAPRESAQAIEAIPLAA